MPVYICGNCKANLPSKKVYTAGAKVTCPKCKKPFAIKLEEEKEDVAEVEEAEKEVAAKAKDDDGAAADDDDDKPKKKRKSDDDDDGDKPKKKKRKSDDDEEDEDEPKKKRTSDDDDDDEPKKTDKVPAEKGGSKMFVILGVAGVVLLSCCCFGGIGGWYGYSTFFAKSPVYGAWMGKDNPFIAVEFRNGSSGGSAFVPVVEDVLKEGPKKRPEANATFKLLDDKTVEITMDDLNKKISFAGGANSARFTYVLADNTLTLTNVSDKKETKFRKAGDRFR